MSVFSCGCPGDLLDRNGNNLSPSILFGGKPDILFDAGLEAGQCCGRSPKQLKTREKTVYTMHIGGFVAQEKIVSRQDKSVEGGR